MAKPTHNTWIGIIILSVFSLGIVILMALGLANNPNAADHSLVGKPATAFEALDIREPNKNISLALTEGKPAILNFWASWCVSCREEARELEAFHRKHGDKVKVIGVAVQDQRDAALAFAAEHGKTYPLGLDESGRINTDYGVIGVPETFYLDEKGVIQEKIVGPVTLSGLEAFFADSLK